MKINIINKLTVCGCLVAGLGFTSCDDFLTITPTSQIVEEDFWENKGDVENVVAACYTRMTQDDMVEKFIQWGELRSDNFTVNTGKENWTNGVNLMNANLLPTNGIFNWECFYNEINYCNKVLKYGPEVVKKDESFSESDWLPIKAEMIALRALSHFYLVRTFGDVPYVTKEYNNDSENFLIAQSTQQQVLDSIIADLESVKDVAMKDYGNTVYNKGRITKTSLYTLLADVYLWRASKNASPDSVAVYGNMAQEDYRKCIECCDAVIDIMKADRIKAINNSGLVLGGVNRELTIEDLLIPNEISSSSTSNYFTYYGAYDYIFGSGNSIESIFELQFDGQNNANTAINGTEKSNSRAYYHSLAGNSSTLVGTEALFQSVSQANELYPSAMFTKTDMRRWETIKGEQSMTTYPICKYTFKSISQSNGSGANSVLQDNTSDDLFDPSKSRLIYDDIRSIPSDANWIVYRLSDVILMKAEAMSQLYMDEENLKSAFNLVREVFKRSNPYAYNKSNTNGDADSLKFETFATQEGIEALVMSERHREFVGEGKRWFDLVRYAQRKGSTKDMIENFLGNKFGDRKKAISAKLSTLMSLFSPIYENEMKRNGLLHQNIVWKTSETTSKTDEL